MKSFFVTLLASSTLLAATPASLPAHSLQQDTEKVGLVCEITETLNSDSTQFTVRITDTGNPHGDSQTFELKKFGLYSGMIAKMGTYAIIHIYSSPLQLAFTAHADLSGTGAAYYQIHLPSNNPGSINAIHISCARPELVESPES